MKETLKFIYFHPFNQGRRFKAILNFLLWQLKSRIWNKYHLYQFTENSKLIVKSGMTGATGNIYTGLHEFSDMGFLLHFLRKNDIFVDIGSNIGSYTILAASEIGSKTICVEPIPSTFEILKKNIKLNEVEPICDYRNIGLSSQKGILKFTKSLDTINHVATDKDTEFIEVTVDTLDNIVGNLSPILIKIDVEGFETEVLNGGVNVLSNPSLLGIIIELNGSGNRYNYDENEIHEKLLKLNFIPYNYDPIGRKLSILKTYGKLNTIYLRNFDFVNERVTNAKKIKIKDKYI